MIRLFSRQVFLLISGGLLVLSALVLNQFTWLVFFDADNYLSIDNKITFMVFDIISIIFGSILIKSSFSKNRINKRELIYTLIMFSFFMLIMEGSLRLFFKIKYSLNPQSMTLENRLGWQTTPNIYLKINKRGYGVIEYTTYNNGFRLYGDVNTDKMKIFVVGDSQTQAYNVSDGKTYYDHIKQNNDVELFAYGGGGYGTLQQYMIIDSFIDIIKPDLLILQFCSNDFINNDHYLESNSFNNNNKKVRPYLINNNIIYLYPKQEYGTFYNILNRLYLFRIIIMRLGIVLAEQGVTIETELRPDHPHFQNSQMTTSDIVKKIKNRIRNVKMVAFTVDRPSWIGNTFNKICEENKVPFITGIPDSIEAAKAGGMIIDGMPYDPHWNNYGHAICGRIINNYLHENNYIIVKSTTNR